MIPFHSPNGSNGGSVTPATESAEDKAAREEKVLLNLARVNALRDLAVHEIDRPRGPAIANLNPELRVFANSFASELQSTYFPHPIVGKAADTSAAPEFIPPVSLQDSASLIEKWHKTVEQAQTDTRQAISEIELTTGHDAPQLIQLGTVLSTLGNMVGALDQAHRAFNPEDTNHIRPKDEAPTTNTPRQAFKSALIALDNVHTDLGNLSIKHLKDWSAAEPKNAALKKVADDLRDDVLLSMDESMKGVYMRAVEEMAQLRLSERKVAKPFSPPNT